MQWQQVSIYTTTGALDNVCAMLCSLNINGMEIEDSADFNDFLENSKQYWDYVDDDLMKEKTTCPTRVKIYLPDNVHGREQLVEVKTALERLKQDETINWGSLKVTADNVDEADWENNWKQYFKPLPIGQNILVVPLWEKNVDTAGRLVLKIDPGMLFGTGTHQTTQLCMELLERFVTNETNLLDLGCGSGHFVYFRPAFWAQNTLLLPTLTKTPPTFAIKMRRKTVLGKIPTRCAPATFCRMRRFWMKLAMANTTWWWQTLWPT